MGKCKNEAEGERLEASGDNGVNACECVENGKSKCKSQKFQRLSSQPSALLFSTSPKSLAPRPKFSLLIKSIFYDSRQRCQGSFRISSSYLDFQYAAAWSAECHKIKDTSAVHRTILPTDSDVRLQSTNSTYKGGSRTSMKALSIEKRKLSSCTGLVSHGGEVAPNAANRDVGDV